MKKALDLTDSRAKLRRVKTCRVNFCMTGANLALTGVVLNHQ
jgi:hypothetical protein